MAMTTAQLAIETARLGKRYPSGWALQDCTITVPQGVVSALVGPNGAGKTTLLKILVSLARPSVGSAAVLGRTPTSRAEFLQDIGYLAQGTPLYNSWTAADHLAMGAHLDTHWDDGLARRRLRELAIPLHHPVGTLSVGQRAQVGLALALAKRPQVLFLDEPVAALDPLARREFLISVGQAVAEAGGALTVMMSSHLVSDLQRLCDHIIILGAGTTQVCDAVDQVLATHKVLVSPPNTKPPGDGMTVIHRTSASTASQALIRWDGGRRTGMSGHDVRDADLDEIVMAYLARSRGAATEEDNR